ncbi:23S rRNA (uridine(2479)-2'-O)-methyltransferase [Nocardioides dokdonensis FR1436]|uniref:23S rRNA (Uridine(2479)-2'-O)-methyltransferase n=1 Tax=Nocardioides dokdonensis FR1436 TaxID=1300347 RepID=A0A1A9GMF7_9ACTN|nr:RNA methyltransferase [Nocardioides dokdonensis]ANH39464.1 23S rRNA (uridine(2479)-2'-O)-methyltransferase [Nocardioides dokdonensis FR1436]
MGPSAPLVAGNARVKDARRLSRRSVRSERRLFLADGPKAVEGALEVPGRLVEVFATPAATERYDALARAAREADVAWTTVDDRALASLSDAVSPAGLVGVCHFLDVGLDEVLASAPRLLAICADVRDPGNAGTVIRCADAAGADAVVLAGSSVDAYNPKTVRASVGSLFHLPVVVEPDAAAAVRAARAAGLTVLAADGAGERDLYADAPLEGPVAWLLGNEAWGLPEDLAALADHRVAIPIHGRAESLNLSTAAALCLYETARHHRRG